MGVYGKSWIVDDHLIYESMYRTKNKNHLLEFLYFRRILIHWNLTHITGEVQKITEITQKNIQSSYILLTQFGLEASRRILAWLQPVVDRIRVVK